MNAEQMWKLYSDQAQITASYDAWAFGIDADELAQLVLKGIKTATASALPLYEVDAEELPQAGQYSVVVNSREEAVCVIRTDCVFTVPFDEVDERQAWKEGEGDRSLAYWRSVHEDVFRKWLEEEGLAFTEKMPVVCEEFVRVFP